VYKTDQKYKKMFFYLRNNCQNDTVDGVEGLKVLCDHLQIALDFEYKMNSSCSIFLFWNN